VIRKHIENDLEQIMKVWGVSSTLAHPFLKPEFVEMVEKAMRDIYIPNSETWVYEKDSDILGFVSMINNEIGGLFVLPQYHGEGIGTQLVNYLKEIYTILEVEVFEKNKIGRAFYKKYGFVLNKEYTHVESGENVLRLKM
jgi:putative acetyltransferase